MTSRPRVPFSGILLIVLGALFLAGTLGGADVGEIISAWWPSLLIVVGLERILNAGTGRGAGIALVAIGATLLAFTAGGLSLHVFGRFWPLLLILFGLGIVLRSRR